MAVAQTGANVGSAGTTIARTVPVEVTPQQVARLAQAQATGRLALSLVGANDESIADAVDVDSQELLGIQAEEAVVIEQQRTCSVKTRRGAEVADMPIPCTD